MHSLMFCFYLFSFVLISLNSLGKDFVCAVYKCRGWPLKMYTVTTVDYVAKVYIFLGHPLLHCYQRCWITWVYKTLHLQYSFYLTAFKILSCKNDWWWFYLSQKQHSPEMESVLIVYQRSWPSLQNLVKLWTQTGR